MFKTTDPHNRLNSGKRLHLAALLIAILIGACIGWWAYHTYQNRPARLLAVQAAEAFFSVDYHDQEGWIQALCTLSTAEGCRYLAEIMVPALWSDFQRNRTLSQASTQSAEKVHNFFTSNQQQAEIWQVALTLDRAWPQDPDGRLEFEVFVLLFHLEPAGWQFERILSDDEMARLKP